MAGAIAHLTGGREVVVAESGQGILGPWLVPVGNEAPDIRTHPLFARCIEAFLRETLGTELKFMHPQLFRTKAETLQAAALKSSPGWMQTHSCPRDARHVSIDHTLRQCGVCSACLLRRQSVFSAGLRESDPYYWNDLRAPSLDEARLPGGRAATDNDYRIAKAGVLSNTQLAAFTDSSEGKRRIPEAAQELAESIHETPQEVETKLGRLLQKHTDEWNEFVGAQGPDSFISQWRSIVQC